MNIEKDFYQLFKADVQDVIQLDCLKRKITKETVVFYLDDNSEITLRISLERKGYGKDEFGVYSGFIVKGGGIIDIINSSQSIVKFTDTVLAGDTSFSFIKKLHAKSYHVTKDNYIDQCRHIIQDMQEYYIPVIKSFIWQPEYAVKNFDTLEYYKFIKKNRFTVGVTLAFLAEIPSFIDELITMATVSKSVMNYDRKDYFKDYFLASNPYEEIIAPIKLAIEKKKMST
ncbi:hypothetical protein [Treponema pedis]|uniref:hypothetical protein n=1 Tax=Treponema pedis TaxID=409322 RepID=UPI00041A1424|nr:hypothetical protein [Treponema pedis]